jgi:c-di-GMP-binding flagellar brake protein YcgR
MTLPADDTDGLSRYKIHARREVINLLRNAGARNQFIRVDANKSANPTITSILHVDEANGAVIIDCAPSTDTNQRILESDDIRFETMLENIRILFSVSHAQSCMHEGRPALRIPLPASLIRLQRREFYRVQTSVAAPVCCTIQIPDETGNAPATAVLPLYNVSGGGIGVVDEKKLINPELGGNYENCRIDLPGGAVTVTLRLKNSQELTLRNGKNIRRLGFMFVDLSAATEATIQRYIAKLEREQNARASGLR